VWGGKGAAGTLRVERSMMAATACLAKLLLATWSIPFKEIKVRYVIAVVFTKQAEQHLKSDCAMSLAL